MVVILLTIFRSGVGLNTIPELETETLQFPRKLENVFIVKKGNQTLVVQGVCFFDALIHALTSIYLDDRKLQRILNKIAMESEKMILARFLVVFARTGGNLQLLRWRTEILSMLFDPIDISGRKVIDAFCDTPEPLLNFFAYFFPRMFSTNISTCKNTIRILNVPYTREYDNLNSLMHEITYSIERDYELINSCNGCEKNHQGCCYDYGFILIDPNTSIPIDRSKIPNQFHKGNQLYTLKCCIDYFPDQKHVAATCLRNGGKWKLYNDADMSSTPANIQPIWFIIYERKTIK